MTRWSVRDLVLAGSLAANLLLVGFVVGAGVRYAGGGAPPPDGPVAGGGMLQPRVLFESLTPDEREALRRRLRGDGVGMAPLLRDVRDARRDLDAAMRAEPFDDAQVRAVLERVRDVEQRMQARSQELMVDILADMPTDERARVLEAMRERRRFPGPRGGGGGPPRD